MSPKNSKLCQNRVAYNGLGIAEVQEIEFRQPRLTKVDFCFTVQDKN